MIQTEASWGHIKQIFGPWPPYGAISIIIIKHIFGPWPSWAMSNRMRYIGPWPPGAISNIYLGLGFLGPYQTDIQGLASRGHIKNRFGSWPPSGAISNIQALASWSHRPIGLYQRYLALGLFLELYQIDIQALVSFRSFIKHIFGLGLLSELYQTDIGPWPPSGGIQTNCTTAVAAAVAAAAAAEVRFLEGILYFSSEK